MQARAVGVTVLPIDGKSLANACNTDAIDDEFVCAGNVVLIHANPENLMPLTPEQFILKLAEHFAALQRPRFLRRRCTQRMMGC